MALQTSGAISLNDIHIEAGGTSGTQCSMNDTDIRGLTPASGKTINSTLGTQVDFNNYYGASGSTLYQMTGSGYIAFSSDAKFGGPASITFLATSTLNTAWVDAMASYNTSFSSFNNKSFTIEDYQSSSSAVNGPHLLWSYDHTSATVRASGYMTSYTTAQGGADAKFKSGVYCKLYYNNSLIDTWTVQQEAAAYKGFALRKVNQSSTSSSYNVIGSRTNASLWRLDLYV